MQKSKMAVGEALEIAVKRREAKSKGEKERYKHPSHHVHRDLTSLAPHERLPELPVVPREKPHTDAAA